MDENGDSDVRHGGMLGVQHASWARYLFGSRSASENKIPISPGPPGRRTRLPHLWMPKRVSHQNTGHLEPPMPSVLQHHPHSSTMAGGHGCFRCCHCLISSGQVWEGPLSPSALILSQECHVSPKRRHAAVSPLFSSLDGKESCAFNKILIEREFTLGEIAHIDLGYEGDHSFATGSCLVGYCLSSWILTNKRLSKNLLAQEVRKKKLLQAGNLRMMSLP